MDKILLVDDDTFFHEMVKSILENVEIISVYSGEESLDKVKSILPDLILLDIQMDGMNGYETGQKLKEIPELNEVPIIFISALDHAEDKLKAYGIGAIDYIRKPFHHAEFKSKIEQLLSLKKKTDEAYQQLKVSHQLITDVQRSAAQNQAISRFAQTSLFCHDLETLVRLFFLTTGELQTSCILKLNTDPVEIHSNNGHLSKLEEEILELSPHLKRIYSFGNNRAVFNWPHASLLVRNIDGLIDTLALLMDAFESAYKSIQAESDLLRQVQKIESDNEQVKDEIHDYTQQMKMTLGDTIMSLGLIAELEPEEEDKLNDIVSNYQQKINNKLDIFSQNSQTIIGLINNLREPPEELVKRREDRQNKTDEFDDILV